MAKALGDWVWGSEVKPLAKYTRRHNYGNLESKEKGGLRTTRDTVEDRGKVQWAR